MSTVDLLTEVTRIGEDSVELKFGKWRFTWGRDDALEIAQAMIEAVSPVFEVYPKDIKPAKPQKPRQASPDEEYGRTP